MAAKKLLVILQLKDCRYTRYAATFFISFALKLFVYSYLRRSISSKKFGHFSRYNPLHAATSEQLAIGSWQLAIEPRKQLPARHISGTSVENIGDI
ncbi:MAG TPA: hypothetical protein VNV88_14030 [Candidatus Solibacter sp.]|nr:hypothetical protein [Candidatus Solibacter sp.]